MGVCAAADVKIVASIRRQIVVLSQSLCTVKGELRPFVLIDGLGSGENR